MFENHEGSGAHFLHFSLGSGIPQWYLHFGDSVKMLGYNVCNSQSFLFLISKTVKYDANIRILFLENTNMYLEDIKKLQKQSVCSVKSYL